MATIAWTDSLGGATLRSLYDAQGAVATRLKSFLPSRVEIGDRASQMSTGRTVAAFIYRTEYGATFEFPNLSPRGPSGVNMVSLALRFSVHAANGGLFTVDVQDDVGTASRVAFAAAPPTVTLSDPAQMLYTLGVSAIATTAAPWVAIYGGARD